MSSMVAAAADMFPVRVLVETVRHQHCLGCAHDGNPLVDTFAVIGGQTMLCQLVETVLAALGLPQLVQDSKGLIQINGWKAISFETITDNPEELVSNLFREISTHITLKILAKRSSSEPNGLCLAELKQRLLKTAIEKQPHILTTANGQEVKEILQQVIQGDQQCSAWSSREQTEAVNEWLEQMTAQHEESSRKSPLCITRFSPISELPRLERWFHSDPNPSRQKLHSYMNILNISPYRRANNKVTYQQICNWFINQRRTTAPRNGTTANKKQQQHLGGGDNSNSSTSSSSTSSSSAAIKQQPIALLPLNATGEQLLSSSSSSNQQLSHLLAASAAFPSFASSAPTNLALLNTFASSLANANMDPSQFQQKFAALFGASVFGEDGRQSVLVAEQQQQQQILHQIPVAHGPPLDIRSKFNANRSTEQNYAGNGNASQADGNAVGGGQHSDRMDGGSESPTGNDDMSEQSGTDGMRDSIACSPEQIFIDGQQKQQRQQARHHQPPIESPFNAGQQQQQPEVVQQQCPNNAMDEIATQQQLLNRVNELSQQQQQQQQSSDAFCLPPLPSATPQQQTPLTPVGLNLSHFLQPVVAHTPSTPPPSLSASSSTLPSGPSAAMAAAAAAAAFSSLLPGAATAQSQLQFINQLAMASQFQNLSPAPHQSASKNNSFNPLHSNGAVKSSPSSNSLTDIINREEAMLSVKSEASGFSPPSQGANNSSNGGSGGANGQQQSRSRLMFDPLSELPILEGWFEENPHPGWLQIEQYTDYLNSMTYRQNYPPISTHNVKIWFKNRRAKTKRLQNNNEGVSIVAGSLGS